MKTPPLETCWLCRMMRAFALGGSGALLASSIALVLGYTRNEIAPWAIGGAVLMWLLFPKLISRL